MIILCVIFHCTQKAESTTHYSFCLLRSVMSLEMRFAPLQKKEGAQKAMKSIITSTIIVLILLASGCAVQQKSSEPSVFSYATERLTDARPWTAKGFQNDPEAFQFMIIGDRTGGANVHKTFDMALKQINLLQPEFVINVGDLIEGYSDQSSELNAEWDGIDAMLSTLDARFFRTPGNHDIANKTAKEVWLDRYGATYYHFVYRDVLFLVLDSEDTTRPEPPAEMKEKIGLYNKLQVEDPAKAKAMLAEFMSDEAVLSALSQPVEFSQMQVDWIKNTLEAYPDVRWTFLFMHEPCWENPSESFKKIQALMKGRKHTMFGGHLHYYNYANIDGYEYITMGPVGASFHHEGPGNVDHIMWVTMTDDGPQMGNIALKGLFDRKGPGPSIAGAYDRKGHQPESPKEKKAE